MENNNPMKNKNIIIILLIIIVILISALGYVLLNPNYGKEPVQIKITSNAELNEGENLSVELTDLNKNPISGETVNITITNSKGKVVFDDSVKTSSKGKVNENLDLKKGKYNVSVVFKGNENYTENSTDQNLTIKEDTDESKLTDSESSSSNRYDINNLPPSNDPYPETRRYQADENYVIQEYADNYRSVVDLRTGERHGGYF